MGHRDQLLSPGGHAEGEPRRRWRDDPSPVAYTSPVNKRREPPSTPNHYRLPNLFQCEPLSVSHQLYAVAIPRVLWRGEPDEALRMLRRVRAFARTSGVAARHVAWTRGFELEALLTLARGEPAWRLVRSELRRYWPKLAGKPVGLRIGRMSHFVRYSEIPAAYFSGRLRHATTAMESYLDWALEHEEAYETRNSIFNGDENPSALVRVTLFPLYRASGRSLGDWSRWRDWVGRLHPGLLGICNITPQALGDDPALMPTFHERLRAAERGRRPAFITFGQKDLLQPKRKVLARQKAVLCRKATVRQDARAAMLAEKGARYFPWLDVKS